METKSKWVVDPTHSEVGFKVKHMMISTVTGYFDKFDVVACTNGDDFKDGSVEVSIDVDSVNTKQNDRDNHLKSDDFFNAEKFPKLIFKSKSFDGSTLSGDLTIRDITKEVKLDVDFNGIATDPYGQTKAGFEVTGEISRKEFGLKWNAVTEAGSVVVSDKVKIAVDIQLVKQ
ncbi:MAG: polyisoprenoid-binding protein [Bacteroidales bacterium]|nr:polyisoprenoid-binding protein [Bacteroidales bacterium]